MIKLTKTQINYLESKIGRIINDKIDKFKKEIGLANCIDEILLNEIIAGNIKILPKSEIINRLKEQSLNKSYYTISLHINDLVSQEDYKRTEKEHNIKKTKLNDFKEKLHKAKQNALDNIVLNGVDVEKVLTELDKIN